MMYQPLPPIRVLLLDDHELILRGIRQMLEAYPSIQVLGQFTRSRDLLQALKTTVVDAVVMDFSLGPEEADGLSLIRVLKIKFPSVAILVISASHTPATVSLALRCGAQGFIGKQSQPQELVRALQAFSLGEMYLEARMAEALKEGDVTTAPLASPAKVGHPALDTLVRTSTLTLREREVLRCCLSGLSVTQVAEKFSRSIKTISTQKQSAYRKLGLRSDNELFMLRSQLDSQ